MEVMQPATRPAMAQATATVMVPLPPASRASRNFVGVSRSSGLTIPTRMAMPMATVAENCMVFRLRDTMTTRTTRGRSRYTLGSRDRSRGSSSRGMPFRPSFLASRCTAM